MLKQIPKYFFKSTKVVFKNEARKGMLKGIELLNKATQSTLGPKVTLISTSNIIKS